MKYDVKHLVEKMQMAEILYRLTQDRIQQHKNAMRELQDTEDRQFNEYMRLKKLIGEITKEGKAS